MSASTLDDPVTIGDRYAHATHATDLTPSTRRITDADVLMAAGMATSGNRKLQLAMSLYRMRVNGDMSGLLQVVQTADEWLNSRLHVKGNRPMSRPAREALIADTLKWWIDPTCAYCDGHGFAPDPDAPRLTLVECASCHGKGQRPLAREVPHSLVKHAQWLVDQLDSRVLTIHQRMSELLSVRMEL